ncbi:PIR protein, putative [Plasmodium sp.]|nr:PIR protein, putative [Plasmodium sp.]
MKVHYINILFFALPLNILDHNQRNHNSTTYHASNTKPTKTYRTLSECELYSPSNYYNDPEMKEVMENFNRQTSERSDEYNERMQEKRKQCKVQCDKDIQKIILKDKIEKELAQQLSTLETNIDTNNIPTCVFKKSVADKVEKTCVKCGYGLGGALTSWEIFGYTGIYGWKIFATAVAKEIGIKAGIKTVIAELEGFPGLTNLPGFKLTEVITAANYWSDSLIIKAIETTAVPICGVQRKVTPAFCNFTHNGKTIVTNLSGFAERAAQTASEKAAAVTGEKLTEVTTTTGSYSNVMIFSGVAILVIVLIMVIIYLILRYRRKKKMKKKLQYIKLLKE